MDMIRHQVLRSHMLNLLRLSQRTIDCCMKGYETGNMEFFAPILIPNQKLDQLHQIISELTDQLKTTVLLDDAQVRFVQASEAICAALAAAYNHSLEIARETYILCKSGPSGRSTFLVRRCEEVNGWARLCTIAAFEQNIEHATASLRARERRGCRFGQLIRAAATIRVFVLRNSRLPGPSTIWRTISSGC